MKLKSILYMLAVLPLLWSCNDEDNIDDIFMSGIWNVGNFYATSNWNSNNDKEARPLYTKPEDLKALNQLTIQFNNDGTFSGKLSDGTYSGKWQANGKDRSVMLSDIQTTNTPSGKSRELINALKDACFYRGDSNYLKLAPEDKKSYVQFAHYN